MMSGGTKQILALVALIHTNSMLWWHELIALVRCYFEDYDAAMGLLLAHFQEAQHDAVEAGCCSPGIRFHFIASAGEHY